MMVITVGGQKHEFDEDRLMISEAIVLKKVAGMGPERLFGGLRARTCDEGSCDGWSGGQPCEVDEHKRDQDPESLKALVWLAVRRDLGADTPRYSEFDFNLADVDIEDVADDGQDSRDEGGEEQDPTPPRQTGSPRRSSTRGRRSSPTSSGSTRGTSAA